ncbi:MAG: efflux RND transporter periplasmic adaptor subunit [Verrucomicrobiota bacterium]
MADSTPQTKRSDDSSHVPPTPAPGKKRRHGPGIFIIVAIVILLVIAGIFLLRPRGPAPAAGQAGRGRGGGLGPTIVSTTTAQQGDIGIYVNDLGAVTPLNMVSVNTRVSGQIVKIDYQEGQFVHMGDPLLTIDPGPNQAALTQSQGQLERDLALLADAKLDLQRYQEAYASNAIPKQQLDTQVALVQQDDGTVKLDQGELDNAKVQLAYCYITAPISGRIGLRLVDLGNIVQAGSTNLVVITQLQPISVIFNVAEDDLPQIQKQLRLGKKLVVDAFDRDQQNKLATGTLETLDNQINPTTGTVQFRAIFDNEDESLFPNQFVNARLLVNTLSNVTLLPNTVLQRNADSAFVYTVQPVPADAAATNSMASAPASTNSSASTNAPASTNQMQMATITMQTITVGTTDGNVSEVEGIDPGTMVVADNFNKLIDGAKVMLRPSNTSTNGTSGARTHKRKKKVSQ